MDTTQYAEGQFISAELVKQSPSKKVYISADAKVVVNKFGNNKLELPVEIDGKPKIWGLFIDHVKNLQEAYGKDSRNWIGQTVSLRIVNVGGKETVVAIPEKAKTEEIK